ncbi:hypothetical protein PAXRUDRAFT_834809 [Paxillus rubicundulus Ve08.2h10]|uniref:Unplaced genomic scaffold scaffold_1961, whole genome shotgun sequence n=1 Tax=Paxillus rubicundulus Ve08.2h10 TaxID=930991 RepID=A0A0D0DBD1_9AGAM|nr:hypothetical protein PAXRUDRAFT_834809 [Paxillus rubicundulus Ve08.2h10]
MDTVVFSIIDRTAFDNSQVITTIMTAPDSSLYRLGQSAWPPSMRAYQVLAASRAYMQ